MRGIHTPAALLLAALTLTSCGPSKEELVAINSTRTRLLAQLGGPEGTIVHEDAGMIVRQCETGEGAHKRVIEAAQTLLPDQTLRTSSETTSQGTEVACACATDTVLAIKYTLRLGDLSGEATIVTIQDPCRAKEAAPIRTITTKTKPINRERAQLAIEVFDQLGARAIDIEAARNIINREAGFERSFYIASF